MRQCTSCKTLFDNSIRYCERCGEEFPYDPKVTPYSEKRIAVILIIIVAMVLLGYNTYIKQPINSAACSRTNYLRVQKIIADARYEVMRVQDHGFIPFTGATTVMVQKYKMESIYLPPCFEGVRQDMVEYFSLMHRVTTVSAYGGNLSTSSLLEKAFHAQKRVDATMEKIYECLPNCPSQVQAPAETGS